jgi:hypothetical protein
MSVFRKASIIGATLLVSSLPIAASAMAHTFDGEWSVQIVSKSATCGDGTTVSIDIADGRVASSAIGVAASGHVGDSGAINVTLANGVKRAAGSGHLAGSAGSGTWRGLMCSGTWVATKR